jgi:hypothetical protein
MNKGNARHEKDSAMLSFEVRNGVRSGKVTKAMKTLLKAQDGCLLPKQEMRTNGERSVLILLKVSFVLERMKRENE